MHYYPSHANLKNAVVVNSLVEVITWPELVATSLASHYNHYILLNSIRRIDTYSPSHANSKVLVKFTQVTALIEFAVNVTTTTAQLHSLN